MQREFFQKPDCDWFNQFGAGFGWVEQPDLDQLQEFVNTTGKIGVMVGKKAIGHGHITIVVPEQTAGAGPGITAMRNANGNVINPLQSQAGSVNFEFGHSTIQGLPWFGTDGHVSSFYIFNPS